MDFDASRWSGEGEFTQLLAEAISQVKHVLFVRVEDAPSTRSEADYNFISNEVYVRFETNKRVEYVRWLGFLPGVRSVRENVLKMSDLETILSEVEGIGSSDYADDEMLQYLRTERIIPPYQTRGYKLVELVRVYEVGDLKTGWQVSQ